MTISYLLRFTMNNRRRSVLVRVPVGSGGLLTEKDICFVTMFLQNCYFLQLLKRRCAAVIVHGTFAPLRRSRSFFRFVAFGGSLGSPLRVHWRSFGCLWGSFVVSSGLIWCLWDAYGRLWGFFGCLWGSLCASNVPIRSIPIISTYVVSKE